MCRSALFKASHAMPVLKVAAAWLAACLVVSAPLHAMGTPAGTLISNIAQASYLEGGVSPITIQSNTAQLRIDEIVDLSLSAIGAQPTPAAADGQPRILTFQLLNSGNGPEQFALTADDRIGGNDFTPGISFIALDRDGNGRYEELTDTPYRPGLDDPLLAADEARTLFVISPLSGNPVEGQRAAIELRAHAATGSGTAGLLRAGMGAGGGDAVIGASGGTAAARGSFLVASSVPTLRKSISNIKDGNGGDLPVAGAVLTYSIVADLCAAPVSTPVLEDAIPAGTAYEPGSITLNGQTLTDDSDSDPGSFTGAGVRVALDPAALAPSTISFRVRIL